jgi:putative membrane protein
MGEGRMPPGLKPDFTGMNSGEVSMLLASRRTQVSLHRTRMSADRTLMSVVRTALSLIGFGFTIFQFFRSLRQSIPAMAEKVSVSDAKNFGMTLVLLGVGMLVLGISGHARFMWHLRKMRSELAEAGLIQAEDVFPVSTTLVIATALLIAGIVAFVDMLGRAVPGP